MILKDGAGTGNQLKINSRNQAEVFAEIRTEIASVSLLDGQTFVLSSGFIPITTTASFSGILYIKNTDTEGRNMFIEHIRVCGTGSMTESLQCIAYRNPTTGTLISGATDANKANTNFGSANIFNGIAYKGADATTVTNGDWFTQFVTHLPGHSIQSYNDSIVIPKNSAIAFAVKPSAATEVCMEVNVHFK